jgi:hypothetical protein
MSLTSAYQNVSWDNVTSFSQFMNNANASGGNYVFTMITYLVFFVLLITLTASFGWESALLSSAFIGLILGLLFSYAGLANWVYSVSFFVGIIVLMIIYSVFNRND